MAWLKKKQWRKVIILLRQCGVNPDAPPSVHAPLPPDYARTTHMVIN